MTNEERSFVELVWDYYQNNARTMPWREPDESGNFDPYKILVSEIMLQQTQVDRVIPKYNAFIEAFPNCKKLAISPLGDVLKHWSGLGYNRRAKYLHDVVQSLADRPFPRTVTELTQFKGIGENTAAAILTYSFNEPHVFIETNLRTVLIHHFFPNHDEVSDTELKKLLARVIDKEHPREFMWAMMDYGAFLKKQGNKAHARSKEYAKQSTFEGSKRQIRGKVLRYAGDNTLLNDLHDAINDERLDDVLAALQQEGLISIRDRRVVLP